MSARAPSPPSGAAAGAGLAVGPLCGAGHREPVGAAAEGDPGQELRQLLRVLREVGAGGAGGPPVPGDGGEPEIKWVPPSAPPRGSVLC